MADGGDRRIDRIDVQRESEDAGGRIAAVAATVSAPAGLRERIAAAAPARARRRGVAFAAACAAVVAALAVALLARPGDDEPSVAATAEVALLPATAPAPSVDRADRRYVDAGVGDLRFPNYGYDAGWRTTGARRDRLDGRGVLTVFYRRRSHRIGYSIVDGAPLAQPATRAAWRDGHRYGVLRRDGALVVTWRQDGHTCVLASRSAPLRALLALAAWG